MKRKTTKLSLKTETLKDLQLAAVQGGQVMTGNCKSAVSNCATCMYTCVNCQMG